MCETIDGSGYMASNMEDQEIVLALKQQLNVMFQALQAITTSSANLATLTGMLQPVRPPEHISRFVMMFNFWNEYHKNYPVYLREANECLEQELNDLLGALSSDSHPLAKEQKIKHHTDHLMTAVCTLIQRFCSTGSILLHELPNEAFDPSPPTGRAVSPHRLGGYSQGPSVSPPVPHAARAQSPLRACLEQMQGPLPNPGQLANTKKPFLPPGMHRFNPNVPGPRRWSEAAVDTNNQAQQDNSIRRWSMPMQSRFIPMMGQPAGPESAQEFFKELLTESKKGFHSMFKQTYGVIYEQNSYVFSDLFNELEGYYARGKIDLAEAMDSFFNTLYQKMFTVLNAQYKFDDKYLGCVSEYMKELKPFGDVPDKLSVQIKRSFVATRTFAQALNAAADVAKNMINIRPSAECTAALTKMSTCGACSGHTEKPCANFCLNVMKGCLQHYLELDTEWDNFVVNMERVSERLLGPFNIVMVVEPINIKISEAIMNFQETGQDISQQVFTGCGKPVLAGNGRRRRSLQSIRNSNADLFIDDSQEIEMKESKETKEAMERSKRAANPAGNQDNRPHGNTRNSQEIKYEPVKFARNDNINGNNGNSQRGGSGPGSRRSNQNRNNQNRSNFNTNNQNNDNKEPHLDKLVKDIKQKIKDSKKFWSNLPYVTCNNEDIAAKPDSIDNCWNGKAIDRYLPMVASDQSKNPEFPSAANANARQSNLIAQQLFTLRTTINHLRNAYNGMDVEWTDHEDGSVEYGSGSGSGSGNDDDDDSGSGLGPYEFSPPSAPKLPSNVDHTTNTIYTNKPEIHDVTQNHNDVYKNPKEDNSRSDHEEPKEPSSSSPVTSSPWRIRRVLFTYFLPIFVAWFGGICTTDLL